MQAGAQLNLAFKLYTGIDMLGTLNTVVSVGLPIFEGVQQGLQSLWNATPFGTPQWTGSGAEEIAAFNSGLTAAGPNAVEAKAPVQQAARPSAAVAKYNDNL